MKKLYFFILGLFIGLTGFAQDGDGFNYQAIVRDANGNINANLSMNMEISILQESVDGTVVFTETHAVTTNAFGLVNLSIGSQNPSSFSLIDWINGPYFIRTSINGVEFGTSQLMSVPYALHAKIAEDYDETDPFFYASPLINVTQSDIDNWTSKLDEFTELDPEFSASAAKEITAYDIANWDSKLNESDPEFSASIAGGITANDTTRWNSRLDESDSYFLNSAAKGITAYDIANWDSKSDESDPVFSISIAKGITASDTTRWNNAAASVDSAVHADTAQYALLADSAVQADPTRYAPLRESAYI
ncbi:MAG: hypothetical protein GY834_00600, partial [Bacteroidetes bacterium]|nr:hypothetical protein [Bacteroidota bacterium]